MEQRWIESGTEEPLKGGRVTSGVVRCGDTVRRPQCANADFVHKILLHLRKKGVELAPAFLGIDEKGREVISYLPGETPDNIGWFQDETCIRAAEIIRELHEALADFPGAGAGETVCHMDLSPCNFRFRDGVPYGVFDWDAARIGDPLDDLAYAVWLWLDMGNPDTEASEISRRAVLFLDAYGVERERRAGFKERILRQMERVAGSVNPNSEQGRATRGWALSCREWAEKNLAEL